MSKNVPLSGLWAIILGGSSGFGFATAEKLARQGMNVAALYRETSISEKALLEKFAQIASENSV
ncbi:MAG TPA: SDR family NAD(P)-dependent oxidoreductase, partial [Mucilaginibacter sp.]|nr:SDR family NAD(P)-dependent oxidoreductase [Mucilaginibacter sp.]